MIEASEGGNPGPTPEIPRDLSNISERGFIGQLLRLFHKAPYVSTMEWSRKYRIITKKETSFGEGRFNPDLTPYMEYVYDCLDNPGIPTIVAMKSARIAWTETINNYRGKRIHIDPTTMLVGFATGTAAKIFAKEKWVEFLKNCPVLDGLVNFGIAENRKSIFDYDFPGGHLRFATLGSIVNQKSVNLEYIEIEEPDDAPDEVAGQGDTFANLKERQKLVPLTRRKFIFGGTPTFKDLSRVEKAIRESNYLVFKAECHACHELVPMDGSSFENLRYDEYPARFIDTVYGKYDPATTKFICPHCSVEWTFDQKNANIVAGKAHGFTDHTGNFSKGWHPLKPQITEVFGFSFSEMLSPFDGSNFVELAKAEIVAKKELAVGKELLMKSYMNNKRGEPYASGQVMMEAEEMRGLRLNYPEHVCPMEALVVTVGVDVQDNRFAIVKRGWGRNGNSWLITWKEIFGDVLNPDSDVWAELEREVVTGAIPHASGKTIYPSYVSVDTAYATEVTYRWICEMQRHNQGVMAARGVRELRFSDDDIYKEPAGLDIGSTSQVRKTLYERIGIAVYQVGAHKAQSEVLRRIYLSKLARERPNDYKTDIHWFNYQSYGQYEEQCTSCRKIFDEDRYGNVREVYKLIPGKRKEAMDCEKLALHASFAAGIRHYTNEHWESLERYYYS